MEENRTRSSAAGEKRRTWGFTLVELIIVIAILAVLAGVAYPVYTGYITKANEAADLALLGQVNESFTSALYDIGYHSENAPGRTFVIDEGSATTTVTFRNGGELVLKDGLLPQEEGATAMTNYDLMNKTFDKYYSGNETTPFKVFKTLLYNPAMGTFGATYDNVTFVQDKNGKATRVVKKANSDGSNTYTVTDETGKEHEYTIKESDANNFTGSDFNEVGAEDLLGEVNTIVEAFSALSGGSGGGGALYDALMGSPDFTSFASEKLGGTLTPDELAIAMKAISGDPDAQATVAGWSEEKQNAANIFTGENAAANTLVLYAASKSGGLLEDTGFIDSLAALPMQPSEAGGGLNINALLPLLGFLQDETDAGVGVAKAAFGYGMTFSYGKYLDSHPDAAWSDYIKSDEGQADMKAYVSCMDMVNGNATTVDSTTDLLTNGFNDPSLVAALLAAFGGGNT